MSEETRKDAAEEGPPKVDEAGAGGTQADREKQAPAADPENEQAQLESARAELAAARAKADEYWNQFLRSRAELENARRRAERDVEQARRQALEKLATEILSVRDSLAMGVSAADEPNADVAKLREGSQLTLRMLDQALQKFDIAEVNPVGERFDPERHEAMAAQEAADHEPNTVIHVVQKGYVIGERLLRPAMVIVSRRSEAPDDGNASGAGDSQA